MGLSGIVMASQPTARSGSRENLRKCSRSFKFATACNSPRVRGEAAAFRIASTCGVTCGATWGVTCWVCPTLTRNVTTTTKSNPSWLHDDKSSYQIITMPSHEFHHGLSEGSSYLYRKP